MLGKPISRDEINTDVKKYVELQNEIIPLLTDEVSQEAKTFYAAKEISFLFNKKGVDDLFAANPSANALRVYLASHLDGTPTVILIAARLLDSNDRGAGVFNIIASENNAGHQWPSRMLMHEDNSDDFDIISDNG